MLWWFSKKSGEELAEKTEKGFSAVKKDIDSVGKWIKHLDSRDKQLFDIISTLKEDLSSLKDEIESLQEGLEIAIEQPKNKQVFKKLPVLDKQTTVEAVQKAVQTGVHERLLVFTLMNNDMKLSYEDLAMLLGKDKSTVRGQINAIKQKREELIEEVIEKNGKKRVFVPDHLKEKLAKYAKVRGK